MCDAPGAFVDGPEFDGDGHDLAGTGDPVDVAHALDGELGDVSEALEPEEAAEGRRRRRRT